MYFNKSTCNGVFQRSSTAIFTQVKDLNTSVLNFISYIYINIFIHHTVKHRKPQLTNPWCYHSYIYLLLNLAPHYVVLIDTTIMYLWMTIINYFVLCYVSSSFMYAFLEAAMNRLAVYEHIQYMVLISKCNAGKNKLW